MKDKATKAKLLKDLKGLAGEFGSKYPNSYSAIKKSWYLQHSQYTWDDVLKHWPDFATFRHEALGFNNRKEKEQVDKENLPAPTEETKQKILADIRSVVNQYRQDNPGIHRITMKQAWYVERGVFGKADIKNFWSNFNHALTEAIETDETNITRDRFDRKLDETSKGWGRSYFVTTLIAGMELNAPALAHGVTDFVDRKGAEKMFLLQRGPISSYQGYPREAAEHADQFVTECVFNNNIQAFDLMLNPQQISPLMAVGRIAQFNTSVIIASPKQDLTSHPVSQASKLPHLAYTTGSISLPSYRPNRAGRLATIDHINGGLIVEIRNEEEFHVRQVQFDQHGGFYDLNKYYGERSVKKIREKDYRAAAFSLGDIHFGLDDPTAVAAWKRIIRLCRPHIVLFHDLINHESINHHQDKDIVARVLRPEWAKDLKSELDMVGQRLEEWSAEFPDTQLVVVKSNHDEWLEQHLKATKYGFHETNFRVCAEMMLWMLDGEDPLAQYMLRNFKIPNVRFLRRDEDLKFNGIQLGAHGDLTANGNRRGGIRAIERAYGSAVVGHAHTACILRRTWVNGTTSRLRQEWMKGPTSQTHSSTLIQPDGSRQMITVVNGLAYLEDQI